MTFVQIIDCKTDKVDDVSRLLDTWVEQTQGRRTATHATLAKDRADSHHVVEIVEFPSYEEAMRNSNLPETDRIFQELVALCEMPPRFTDLDIVRDEQLNKTVCRRFYDMANSGELGGLAEVFSDRYVDHDPNNEEDIRGVEGMRAEVEMYRQAFSEFRFTIEDQLAEGDRVCTRWSWQSRHTGEFMGAAPTGKRLTLNGMTVHRLREGKIEEGWWNYDFLGLLREIGAIQTGTGQTGTGQMSTGQTGAGQTGQSARPQDGADRLGRT
ncbi:ester cyclase [Actinomycetes bacterium KLBMP 9797]